MSLNLAVNVQVTVADGSVIFNVGRADTSMSAPVTGGLGEVLLARQRMGVLLEDLVATVNARFDELEEMQRKAAGL